VEGQEVKRADLEGLDDLHGLTQRISVATGCNGALAELAAEHELAIRKLEKPQAPTCGKVFTVMDRLYLCTGHKAHAGACEPWGRRIYSAEESMNHVSSHPNSRLRPGQMRILKRDEEPLFPPGIYAPIALQRDAGLALLRLREIGCVSTGGQCHFFQIGTWQCGYHPDTRNPPGRCGLGRKT
jgi:hypothetical protein